MVGGAIRPSLKNTWHAHRVTELYVHVCVHNMYIYIYVYVYIYICVYIWDYTSMYIYIGPAFIYT